MPRLLVGGVVTTQQRAGGVTTFVYRTLATWSWTVRRNSFQQNVLWLLVAAYVVIAVHIANIAEMELETGEAILRTLKLSDLVLVVPLLTLGTWLATAIVFVLLVAFILFLGKGFTRWSELSRSRQTSLVFSTFVTGVLMLTPLVLVPVPAAVSFVGAVALVLAPEGRRGRDLATLSQAIDIGPRDHQSGQPLSLRVVVYATLFGWPDSQAMEEERYPAPRARTGIVPADEAARRYFDPAPGEERHPVRQTRGLLVLLLLGLSLTWSLAVARPWVPTERLSLVSDDREHPVWKEIKSLTASGGSTKVKERVLVGRVLDDSRDSMVVLTAAGMDVVYIPKTWVKARRLCYERGNWTDVPVLQLGDSDTCRERS